MRRPHSASSVLRLAVYWMSLGAGKSPGGALMFDALVTAQGKPESRLRLLFTGTLAPSSSGWWTDLVDGGSYGSIYVQALQGDRSTWDKWSTIRKANPLMALYPESRAKLIEERDAARADSRLKARFLSYRLNVPSSDESVDSADGRRLGANDDPFDATSGRPADSAPSTWALAVHSRRPSLSGNRAVLRLWPLPLAYPTWRPRNGGIGFQQRPTPTYRPLRAVWPSLRASESSQRVRYGNRCVSIGERRSRSCAIVSA